MPTQPDGEQKGLPIGADAVQKRPASPIAPEIYNLVIENLFPLDIRLEHLSFDLREAMPAIPLNIEATLMHPTMEEVQDDVYTVRQRCEFQVVGTDGIAAANGQAVYAIKLKIPTAPPESFWDIFLIRNIKLYTQPALRELTAGLCTKAGMLARPLGSVAVTQVLKKPHVH